MHRCRTDGRTVPPLSFPAESPAYRRFAVFIRAPLPSGDLGSGPSFTVPVPREESGLDPQGRQAQPGLPVTATSDVSTHYTSGELLARLEASLREDGCDPTQPTFEALAPYDHFHGRGLEATEDLVDRLHVSDTDHVLDVGSGIGGPARYLARRFRCQVSGVDLTAEFCSVARHLTSQLGLTGRVSFEQGDALAMPFEDAAFDRAISMNVSMNIADKRALYREIHRVLKPGARLGLAEVVQGPGGEPDYPTPWARTAETSFLATEAETRANLAASGFAIEHLRDTTEASLAWSARARAVVEAGGKPPHRAVSLIHGALADEILAGTGPALRERRTVPIEVVCRKAER